jgi:hypothetical protein
MGTNFKYEVEISEPATPCSSFTLSSSVLNLLHNHCRSVGTDLREYMNLSRQSASSTQWIAGQLLHPYHWIVALQC